jgi:hypothetical protein
MPPVEIVTEKGAKRRLKFLRNTAYEGTNYGPDYESDQADVDPRWSVVFLGNGRAVEVLATTKGGPAKGEVQVRDPAPQHRDPELPLEPATQAKKKS